MDNNKNIMVIDGNEAAAYIAYAFTEVAGIYPITPSSPMAELTDVWSAHGRKNLFGQTVRLVEMQSEAGAIGAVHGALDAGAFATSYTSSQGLMLMIPVMHRLAGSLLPAVLHVASRTVGTHAMSIFGDHSDVMNCRQTGFAMLSSGSVQEVMDLAGIAHLSAISSRIPFLHFFDGFRTSHEIQKVEAISYDDLSLMMDWEAVERFRSSALNPEHPTTRNTVQNPDVFFQFREAANTYYNALPAIVDRYMQNINSLTGRDYQLFNYYGAPDAERVIIAMGSVSGAIRETVDYLNNRGEKVGFVQVHLYRPFSAAHFLAVLPNTTRLIAILDRCKESGSIGEPLYQDVCAVFANRDNSPGLFGGRYGLSSKDTDPGQIKAVFDMLAQAPRHNFTIGIDDDVTYLSLPQEEQLDLSDNNTVSCKFWGLGSDGTVGANKNSIKIIGQHTDKYAQAYFEYDTKKSFGVTKSHLRFGDHPILSSYLVKHADFVACHNQSYLDKYDVLNELKPHGIFLLNTEWSDREMAENLPAAVKRTLADKEINFYAIDANKISRQLGLGNRSSMVLQAAFFALAKIIPLDDAVTYMKAAAEKSFRAKGAEIVAMNQAAVDQGISCVRRIIVPAGWKNSVPDTPRDTSSLPAFIRDIKIPIDAQQGDRLPVSTFACCVDGAMPPGSTAYEKRGIATSLPVWDKNNCLQCNHCVLVCPHAALRPYLLDKTEAAAAPIGLISVPAKGTGATELRYTLQVSALDCTSCGSCAAVCPAKEPALTMRPATEVKIDPASWDYALTLQDKEVFDVHTVKGSQFRQPLMEFSGACAGCGETPYAKLLTQLYGDKMYWANATGCSQAWGAPMPSFPYTTDCHGRGPAWSNSLFENNAEYSLGMALAVNQQRALLKKQADELQRLTDIPKLRDALQNWLNSYDDITVSAAASSQLQDMLRDTPLSGEAGHLSAALLRHSDQLSKKSIWMFGGDGWAYDIGYGGLDHVIALGENVNVFVVDTEVYSNTGGQSSKATPLGSTAQFQSAGKTSPKKDLGRLLMSYGNCYVASVAMGADYGQLLKAITEAESFPGPSVIIAYTPCISHGIKAGMKNVQAEMKHAVEAGYWTLYRFDPRKDQPLTIDSPSPTADFKQFLRGEVRYAALDVTFPERAQNLFEQAEKEAAARYAELERQIKKQQERL